jgi:hypothetical protein
MTHYKILVGPAAACVFETWMLTEADERALGLSDRKISRSTFTAEQDKRQ